MSETRPRYLPAPPAGWYMVRYAGTAPSSPAWRILTLRLDVEDLVLLFTLHQPQWLDADEARHACAAPLPAGLALVYLRSGERPADG